MKTFVVISPTGITLSSGIVSLTPVQAAPRAHALNDLGEGLYEITGTVGFKRGEIFGYDGNVNKSLLVEMVETVDAADQYEGVAPDPRATAIASLQAEIAGYEKELKAAKDAGVKSSLKGVIAALDKKLQALEAE